MEPIVLGGRKMFISKTMCTAHNLLICITKYSEVIG